MSKPGAPTEGNFIVCCRFRPLNQKEIAMGVACSVDFKDRNNLQMKPSAEI